MKQFIYTLALVMAVTMAVPAFAAEKVGPDAARAARRAELKEIKARVKQQRQENQDSKFKQFMKKEGERSGVSNWGKGAGNWATNLNPVPFFKEQGKRYEERKDQK